MSTRSNAIAAVVGVITVSGFLAGCGPKTTAAPPPRPAVAPPAVSPVATTTPTPAARNLTPGNCTLYTRADAVKLLGAVNDNNKSLEINTDGGTKIDNCSYLDLKGGADVQGVTYSVVRYDSDATAFAEAQKVQVEMLGDAASHNWAVQTLTTPVPGAGPLLGGYGTKTDLGIPGTIAVVGTNVGPYLVVALGASTESAANAKNFALTLFQALAVATS